MLSNTESNVLSQPTRARLFELLRELKRPAATDELSRLTELHPNGVRSHLEVMVQAGLLTRELERRGRGRPRDLWAIDPLARPGGEAPTAYGDLSEWLVQAVQRGVGDPQGIEELGRSIGLNLADGDDPPLDAESGFRDALAAMGFQPREAGSSGDEVTYCLSNCPYRDTARNGQALICGLHRGITAGLLESLKPGATLTRFEIKDPDRAGCLVTASGLR
jgi:predicted ArsR family transcriptional regulator